MKFNDNYFYNADGIGYYDIKKMNYNDIMNTIDNNKQMEKHNNMETKEYQNVNQDKEDKRNIRKEKIEYRKKKREFKEKLQKEFCEEYLEKVGIDTRETIAQNYKELKNPLFKANSIDPLTKKYVRSVWLKKISKIDRVIWTQVWEFYRDRKRQSIYDIYKKYPEEELKIIYTGEPQPTFLISPKNAKEILEKYGIKKKPYVENKEQMEKYIESKK